MGQSFRMKQVDELILRSLSNIIRKYIDMPNDVFFTITRVITSPDLALAKIFYVSMPEEKHPILANIIKKNRKLICCELEDDIVLRKIPRLKFIFDKKEVEAYRIDDLLQKLK